MNTYYKTTVLVVAFACMNIAARGGWGWGYYGPREAAIEGSIIGASNIIGSAITADAIKSSNPYYTQIKSEQQDKKAARKEIARLEKQLKTARKNNDVDQVKYLEKRIAELQAIAFS